MKPYLNLTTVAKQVLPSLSALTLPVEDERQRLLSAGVPSSTVASLYPFELDEHLPRMLVLLQGGCYERLAPIFALDRVGDASAMLPKALRSQLRQLAAESSLGVQAELLRKAGATALVREDVVLVGWANTLLYFHVLATSSPMSVPEASYRAGYVRSMRQVTASIVHAVEHAGLAAGQAAS